MNDKKKAIRLFAPYLEKADFLPNRTKNQWIYDGKYYLIVLWLTPCKLGGFFTEIGIKFLWGDANNAFDFYYSLDGVRKTDQGLIITDDCRISIDETFMLSGAILYESEQFDALVEKTIQKLLIQIEDYKKLYDLKYLAFRLKNRHDLFWSCYKNDCNQADFDLGVVKMLQGRRRKAKAIFQYNYDMLKDNPRVSPEYLEKLDTCIRHCGNSKDFIVFISGLINENRQAYGGKHRYKLPCLDIFLPGDV